MLCLCRVSGTTFKLTYSYYSAGGFAGIFFAFRFSVLCRSSVGHRSVGRRIFSPQYKRKSGEPLWITAFKWSCYKELVEQTEHP